jgi:hypothetical protein
MVEPDTTLNFRPRNTRNTRKRMVPEFVRVFRMVRGLKKLSSQVYAEWDPAGNLA